VSITALWHVTSFYRFTRLDRERLVALQTETREWLESHYLRGLVLLAEEGINGTVAGELEAIDAFKEYVRLAIACDDVRFKDSTSARRPFRRLSVDIRSEIVGMKRPELVPESADDHHLSPKEWHEAMESNQPKLVIDTRNRYETLAGKFPEAIDPGLLHFSEWGEYLETAELPTDVPVYLYCTGGIRCEKAILEMRERGFEQVFQLRDGILGYLAEYPNGYFEGDCFVFDDRVALDRDLQPSGRFGICPGCGLTSATKKECEHCSGDYFVCTDCEPTWDPVCSKTCRDRWRRTQRTR